jgi:hypothetical protein
MDALLKNKLLRPSPFKPLAHLRIYRGEASGRMIRIVLASLCMHSQIFSDFFRCCFGGCVLLKITAISRVLQMPFSAQFIDCGLPLCDYLCQRILHRGEEVGNAGIFYATSA